MFLIFYQILENNSEDWDKTCIVNHCVYNKAIDLIYDKAPNTSLPV